MSIPAKYSIVIRMFNQIFELNYWENSFWKYIQDEDKLDRLDKQREIIQIKKSSIGLIHTINFCINN